MSEDATAASSPASASAGQNGLKAAKDRACPFCGQAFTSSSLGRHLDLYIKPKNPKPPDGIHDVDEIKKIRGSITRRQPRSSMKGSAVGGAARNTEDTAEDVVRASSDAPSSIPAPKPMQASSNVYDESVAASPVSMKEPEQPSMKFNTANWLATGVINNLPPRSVSQTGANSMATVPDHIPRIQEVRRDATNGIAQPADYGRGSSTQLEESAELGRAAEMALREVLGSLEAARVRIERFEQLYLDFDFFTLSFPGLCLAILPSPRTLFSPTPFASADTCSLGPPDLRQYETLKRLVHERTTEVRKSDFIADNVVLKHLKHLSGAWEHWQSLSDMEKANAWNLELLRSVHRAGEQTRKARYERDLAKQQVRHLTAEYDRLSRCQLPREYLMHPPNTVPIAPELMNEVRTADLHPDVVAANFDADALIAKWRTTIKATTRPARPATTSHYPTAPPQSSQTPAAYHEDTIRPPNIRDSYVLNGSIWGIGGPMGRDDAETHSSRDNTVIAYETPPQPGLVTSVDDEHHEGDDDADADGDPEDDGRFGQGGALVRRRDGNVIDPSGSPMTITGMLNANGKRQLGSATNNRRGAKMYKANVANMTG